MARTRYKYEITGPYHGELKSLWYITRYPVHDEEDWKVMTSYDSREKADKALTEYKEWEAATN